MTLRIQRVFVLACLVIAAYAAAPLAARAVESPSDLRTAVMTELLHDPRTAAIAPAQLSAIIDALAAQAAKQSITSADILWHPQDFSKADTASQAAAEFFGRCDHAYATLCPFNVAFGFAGSDSNLPAWLFILSATLWLLLLRLKREMEERHASLAMHAG